MHKQFARYALVATIFGCGGALGAITISDDTPKQKPDDNRTVEKTRGEVPAAVKARADKYYGGTAWKSQTVIDDGFTYFVITGTRDDQIRHLHLTSGGEITKIKSELASSYLPAEALARFREQHRDAKITDAYSIEQHYFLLHFQQNGNEHEIQMLPNGRLWSHEDLGPIRKSDDKPKDSPKPKDKAKGKDPQ